MPDLFENTLHSTLIPTKVASEISGYNADYLARLCREEKIQGTQVGRSWLINRVSLEAFVKTQEGKKVERAESLRAEREKEYRRAQKPIMRAAFGSAVVEKTATTRSVISSSPSHQHSTYSRPLVAAAIALMFVTGVAYASSNAAVIGTLASVPNAVVAFARSSSANLISHASFRVTDSKNDKNNALATSATTSPFAFAMRAPSINNTSDALAVFSARASAKSISSVHALTDEARLPFEQTKTAQVAQGRIATLASIAHDPFGSAVNAYVMSGLSLYDAGAVLGDSYLRAINSSGDAALASAATTRDVFAFIPQASTALLDTYAQGVDAFNDVAPKVAGTAILAVYDLGDTTNTAVSAVPSLASQTKDTVANGIVRSALATAASIQNTEANAFAPFVHGAKTLAAIPRAAENTMLGIAGYTAALIDGPQAQPQTLGVAPSTQTAQAASFVSFLPDAWLHGIADAFHSIGNLAQGLISSGFHSLATVLPGGTFITPVLTVLPVGPSETLALPVPAGSLTHVLGTSENTTTTTTGGNTAGGGTTIKQIINNFYPQTLFGSAMQDAVLAIVRPYVQDSIDAAIVSTHSNGGGNTTVVNNSGVSSDGATLTNVNIQSGNGTFSSVTTGTLTAGPSTLATTTVNGDLTVTGNLYANVVISTSSFSGSGSNFNADYLDGFDSTYFLANSFSSTSAAYYLSQNPPAGGSGFSTTSANYWLTGKTTDNLTEGTTNKYYSDTLARNAFSTNATGLTYTSGTGVLSLTSGYSIPLTASTTEWNSAYANRITTANAPLSITGNAISISQANATTNGYLSSTDWNTFNGKISSTSLSSTAPGLAYNSNTGVFSLTAGYTIPTIASTSAWETFYQTPSSRIAAGTNLSWVGNTLNGPSDAYIRGLFSAVSPLSYNSATGVFAFSTSSISGSGSNFNADLLDGLDSAYLLANSFSTSSADFWKTQNNFFSTTSADYWLTGKSTDNLAQGITNLYYSDSRVNSFIAASTTIPKTYTSNVFSNSNIFNGGLTVGTLNGPLQANNGVVSATSSVGVLYGGTGLPVLPSNGQILVGNGTGYTLTSTSTLGLESTLTFTTPLSRTGNVISILQSSGVQSGYLSSTDWNAFNNKISSTSLSAGTGISYNSSTGVIANTGVISFNGRSGVVVPGSSDYTTAQVAESGNLYYTDARARAAISSSATGLTYTSGSGVLSLTAGYTIPLTASTTEWNTAYANRITTANAPLSIAGNAISISQANTSTNGYLSSTDWNTFNGKQTAISFAYPLVNTSNTVSLAFGTSTSNTWGGTQTFTNAPVLGSLTGFLKATAGVLSTSLIDLSTDVSSTLAVSNGGTGLTSYTPGDILYADAGGFLTKLPIGSGGSVLKVQAGLPSWGVDQTVGGGGSDGIFATSTGKIYPLDTASTVIIGANATATANSIFEVSGEAYVSTRLSVGSTSPSSLAILDIGGNAYISGTGTFGQIVDGGLTANTLTYANGSKQLSSVTLGNGLTLVGGTLSVSTSSISGSGSNFNADFLDGQDGTYYLNRANHTGTQLASTISDFSSTARGLLSSTATGLTYTSGTGVFSLTSGYTIPLTASTTEWNSAYANRITSATAPLSISSNTISITQANGSTDGYLSSTDWNTFNSKISSTSLSAGTGISYNSSTGVIANTGVISFNGRSGAVVPGSSDYTTAQVAESGNLYFTNARADARINATSTIGTLTSAPNLGTVLTSLTGILRATSGVLSTGAINLASGDVTGTLPVANGGTGSTTLTGILGGNGTGAVKTIVVGSGLTFDGTTLATSGAGITAIGPAGQLQTGGTQTLATTTSTFNGLTAGITITAAGNTQTFQPTLSGVLTYAGGGTGISSPVAAGVLLGNYSGTGYMQIATSSLGLTTTNVAEGSNLYYTDARARAAISSTATGLT
ncbi:MAG: hypothetical protein JWL75_442, partial [Parcubacteria group bacterium]|nr:hypothetical protein [Parcubacteria group bacterium]